MRRLHLVLARKQKFKRVYVQKLVVIRFSRLKKVKAEGIFVVCGRVQPESIRVIRIRRFVKVKTYALFTHVAVYVGDFYRVVQFKKYVQSLVVIFRGLQSLLNRGFNLEKSIAPSGTIVLLLAIS